MNFKLQSGSHQLKGTRFLIHGGAGPQDPKGEDASQAYGALETIAARLRDHSPAPLSAPDGRENSLAYLKVVQAIQLLEDDPHFNAGLGSALQADGQIRVSASLMDSTRRKFSAVANACSIRHPILLAHDLQYERFCILDQQGSNHLARKLGFPQENLVTQPRIQRLRALQQQSIDEARSISDGTGTVGCVAIDENGALAAGTSTGGVGNETPGRIGDSPTVAGNYCTEVTAVSCTGYGEQIVNDAFAALIAIRVQDGMSLEDAMSKSLEESHSRGHGLAAIAIARPPASRSYHWAAGTTESYFLWAAQHESMISGRP